MCTHLWLTVPSSLLTASEAWTSWSERQLFRYKNHYFESYNNLNLNYFIIAAIDIILTEKYVHSWSIWSPYKLHCNINFLLCIVLVSGPSSHDVQKIYGCTTWVCCSCSTLWQTGSCTEYTFSGCYWSIMVACKLYMLHNIPMLDAYDVSNALAVKNLHLWPEFCTSSSKSHIRYEDDAVCHSCLVEEMECAQVANCGWVDF